jgi:hypothetical protein
MVEKFQKQDMEILKFTELSNHLAVRKFFRKMLLGEVGLDLLEIGRVGFSIGVADDNQIINVDTYRLLDDLVFALKSIGVDDVYFMPTNKIFLEDDFEVVKVRANAVELFDAQINCPIIDFSVNVIYSPSRLDFFIIRPDTCQSPLCYVGSDDFIRIACRGESFGAPFGRKFFNESSLRP